VPTAAGRIGLWVVLGFGRGVTGLGERLVQLFGVEPWIVEGVATTPVRQRKFGRDANVVRDDGWGALACIGCT
jgi:hypothetical protein